MKWTRVEGMKLKPNCCIACGSTGEVVDGDGSPEAYFAEAVDVNWGDSLYLCGTCVRILGQLRGMIDVEQAEEAQNRIRTLEEELSAERASHDQLKTRVERMMDGVRAKKEVQADRPRKKVKT
jgi:hypothetical protein